MKIDTQELQQLAAASVQPAQVPRMDLYTGIHKALRAFMCDTLVAVGRMDTQDDLELAQTTERVMALLDFCRSHLEHENEYIHTAIEARTAGGSQRIAHEHEEHEQHILELASTVGVLRACVPQQRAGLAIALYRNLSLFVAQNFQHMNVEETEHNAKLWMSYSDAELGAIHGALVGSIPPAEMMGVLRWMVPFMNPVERTAMLSGMKAKAPAPVFAAVLDVVRPHLAGREWDKLAASLGIAARPVAV